MVQAFPRHVAFDPVAVAVAVAVAELLGLLGRDRSPPWAQVGTADPGGGDEDVVVGGNFRGCQRDQVRESSTRCSQGAVQSSSQSSAGPETPYVPPASTRQNWE